MNAGPVLFAKRFGMKAKVKPIIETSHVCVNCSSVNLFIDGKPPETARYTCLKSHWSLDSFGGFCKWKLSSLVTFSVRNKDLCRNLGYGLQVSSAFVPNQFHFCFRDILLWKFGSGFSARQASIPQPLGTWPKMWVFSSSIRCNRLKIECKSLSWWSSCSPQAGLIEANGELKVFIDQNLSPGKGKRSIRSLWR